MEGFPRKEGFQGRSPAGVLHGCGAIGGEEGLEGLVRGAFVRAGVFVHVREQLAACAARESRGLDQAYTI